MKGYWYVFGINGKRRLVPIPPVQKLYGCGLYSKTLGKGGNQPRPPPSVVGCFVPVMTDSSRPYKYVAIDDGLQQARNS